MLPPLKQKLLPNSRLQQTPVLQIKRNAKEEVAFVPVELSSGFVSKTQLSDGEWLPESNATGFVLIS